MHFYILLQTVIFNKFLRHIKMRQKSSFMLIMRHKNVNNPNIRKSTVLGFIMINKQINKHSYLQLSTIYKQIVDNLCKQKYFFS